MKPNSNIAWRVYLIAIIVLIVTIVATLNLFSDHYIVVGSWMVAAGVSKLVIEVVLEFSRRQELILQIAQEEQMAQIQEQIFREG